MKTATLSIKNSTNNTSWEKQINLFHAYDQLSIDQKTIEEVKFSIIEGLIGTVTNLELWNIIEACNTITNNNSPLTTALDNIGLDLEYGVEEDCEQSYFIYNSEISISVFLNI